LTYALNSKQADLKPLKPLKDLKPIKYPGDTDARCTQFVCRNCGNILGKADPNQDKVVNMKCPKCGYDNSNPATDLTKFTPEPKGKQYNPYSIKNPVFIPQNTPLMSFNYNKIKEAKKNKIKTKDVYVSDEIKQLPDLEEIIQRKNKKNVDNFIDVTDTCNDLAIDG